MLPAMGELVGCEIPQRGVGPGGVIGSLPIGNLAPSIEEVLEPADVRALLAQSAAEAFDEGSLGGLARSDMQHIDLVVVRECR